MVLKGEREKREAERGDERSERMIDEPVPGGGGQVFGKMKKVLWETWVGNAAGKIQGGGGKVVVGK